MMNSKWAGIVALLVSLAGLMTHPEILGLLPEKAAIAISAIGIALQGITKGVQSVIKE